MPLQRATGALLRRPSLLIIGASALSLVLAALTARWTVLRTLE